MIFQFEGPDGSGKTYFATRIAKLFDLPYYHYPSMETYNMFDVIGRDNVAKDYMCIGEILYTRSFHDVQGQDIVEDRGLLSSVVYGKVRKEVLHYEKYTHLFLLLYVYEKKNEKVEDRKAEEYLIRYKNIVDEIENFYYQVHIYTKPPSLEELVEKISWLRGEEVDLL